MKIHFLAEYIIHSVTKVVNICVPNMAHVNFIIIVTYYCIPCMRDGRSIRFARNSIIEK